MVAIFTGLGSGAERGSAAALGAAGLLGSASFGRAGEKVFLNAATGNLMLSHQDEFLVGKGPDVGISRVYNSRGALDENGDHWRQSTDRRVFGLTGVANSDGSTVRRVSADGSEVIYRWNGSVYQTTDGAGAHDTLSFDSAANEWTHTDGDSRIEEVYFAYNGSHYLRTRTDRDGHQVFYSYDNGKLTDVHTADGAKTSYVWSGDNITKIVTSYTDLANGNAAKSLTRVHYTYDGQSRLSRVDTDLTPDDNSTADGAVYSVNYAYHGNTKRIASISQTDGSQLDIEYDDEGRVVSLTQKVTDGESRTTRFAYEDSRTYVIDPRGQITALTYGIDHRLTEITIPSPYAGGPAQTTSFEYDDDGNVTQVTDASGATTLYTHDARGNVTSTTDALGNQTLREYNADNQLVRETEVAKDLLDLGRAGLTSSSTGDPVTRVDLAAEWDLQNGIATLELGAASDWAGISSKDVVALQAGQTYKLSVEVKVDGDFSYNAAGGPAINLMAQVLDGAHQSARQPSSWTSYGGEILDAGWVRMEYSFTAQAGDTYLRPRVYKRTSLTGNGTVQVRNFSVQSADLGQDLRHSRRVYDDEGHLRYSISAEGRVSELRYTADGELGTTIEYTRNTFAVGSSVPTLSEMNAWRDGLSDRSGSKVVEYTFDARGAMTRSIAYSKAKATSNGGDISEGYRQEHFVHDQHGQLLTRYVFGQAAESFAYDGMGRRTVATDLFGGSTSIVFDDANSSTVVTTSQNHITTSTYNKSGQLIAVTDSGTLVTGGTKTTCMMQPGCCAVRPTRQA